MADNMFQKYDQNGDGQLNYDEMPEALRSERDKWDTNKDGFIDRNEFKAYFQARIQQSMAERAAMGGQSFGGGFGTDPGQGAEPPVEEEKKPVVYRVGNLPKELPSWFKELDTDGDAQIGLYEWKASKRPIEEFMKMDRNGDGFLTVAEVLRYQGLNSPKNGSPGSNGANTSGPSFAGGAGPWAMQPGSYGMGAPVGGQGMQGNGADARGGRPSYFSGPGGSGPGWGMQGNRGDRQVGGPRFDPNGGNRGGKGNKRNKVQ
jgi:Ca2+-binding EF-hand superfamily protein